MINNATQLKAKVRNVSNGNDNIAKSYIRIFFMERFMERLSLSKYKDNFVIKGGMLVSSLLGIDLRSTMDIDTSVYSLTLSIDDVKRIIQEISNIEIEDNVKFEIAKMESIMEDFDYPGIRVHLLARMDRIVQPFKIDISTDDAIVPGSIEYEYKLVFDDRIIKLNSYNIETMLAEKIQTIIDRGEANTRMRDLYDVYELEVNDEYSVETLRKAFDATCKKRDTVFSDEKIYEELNNIKSSKLLRRLWNSYKEKNYYVEELSYDKVVRSVEKLINDIYDEN